ncbi:hypothetical protein C0Q44_27935 [Paenibacillus sp. PCH8]|uniref:hypothetical protein n=1 Tax=Paenibacillus sp. PCH8 TaxID=2066524 RepID=UPI000CF8CB74|nr:hypothetical protein [Paenibacillus sp. PCH8]PQP80248.1 hypothetical protein C0Q44_27935 [Paenibacillus sp. PCH8]
MNSREVMILVEEDYSSKNVSAYAPEFRLSVVGDTETEVLESLKDLIKLELDKSVNVKRFSSKFVSMPLESSLPLTAV